MKPEQQPRPGKRALRIAFATSELQPFSKSGGLADVSAALPRALGRLGHKVQIFTPLYPGARAMLDGLEAEHNRIEMPHGIWVDGREHALAFAALELPGCEVIFVENADYFDRSGYYLGADGRDYEDNVARFSFFCRAILEYFLFTGDAPDVLHCNDWQTALLPVYLRSQYPQALLQRIRCLLTIHNLGYQGLFPAQAVEQAGLSWDLFHIDGLEYYGQLNLLKGGIVCADAVSTVSPSYAREIQKEEYGHGLAGLLRAQSYKLSGILNGIDTEQWNPEADPLLVCNYSAARPGGKADCKRALQTELGLPARRGAMLLGMVSRLDVQKGVDLLIGAFEHLARLDLQLVVLGSGDPRLEEELSRLAEKYPKQVAVRLGFDERIAHLIYAGSDAFLMPSRYEPCGLSQMYAQRYGSLPVVRETGGLRDTVRNAGSRSLEAGTASGFVFKKASPARLADAVRKALDLYKHKGKAWQRLQKKVMSLDNSWEGSAKQYVRLYRRMLRAAEQNAQAEGKVVNAGAPDA